MLLDLFQKKLRWALLGIRLRVLLVEQQVPGFYMRLVFSAVWGLLIWVSDHWLAVQLQVLWAVVLSPRLSVWLKVKWPDDKPVLRPPMYCVWTRHDEEISDFVKQRPETMYLFDRLLACDLWFALALPGLAKRNGGSGSGSWSSTIYIYKIIGFTNTSSGIEFLNAEQIVNVRTDYENTTQDAMVINPDCHTINSSSDQEGTTR